MLDHSLDGKIWKKHFLMKEKQEKLYF